MYWLMAGLFFIGAACGATIRLMMFVVVLLCAAAIAVGVTGAHGLAAAAMHAVIALVTLQAGYVAGFVARTAIRSRQMNAPAAPRHGRSVAPPIGQKRP